LIVNLTMVSEDDGIQFSRINVQSLDGDDPRPRS